MKKGTKILFYLSFIIYIFILLELVLLSRSFMLRTGAWLEAWSEGSVFEYFRFNSNFIPFKTIGIYMNAILTGSMNPDIPIKNLLGNLLLFFPLGIYLPIMRDKCRIFWRTLIVILLILIGIEVVQFVTTLGVFDVDDLILNLSGAVMGYGVWRLLQRVSVWRKLEGMLRHNY